LDFFLIQFASNVLIERFASLLYLSINSKGIDIFDFKDNVLDNELELELELELDPDPDPEPEPDPDPLVVELFELIKNIYNIVILYLYNTNI